MQVFDRLCQQAYVLGGAEFRRLPVAPVYPARHQVTLRLEESHYFWPDAGRGCRL